MLNYDFINIQTPKTSADLLKKTEVVRERYNSNNNSALKFTKKNADIREVNITQPKPGQHKHAEKTKDNNADFERVLKSVDKNDDDTQTDNNPYATIQAAGGTDNSSKQEIQLGLATEISPEWTTEAARIAAPHSETQSDDVNNGLFDFSSLLTPLSGQADLQAEDNSSQKLTLETLQKIIALNGDIKSLLQSIKDIAQNVETPKVLSANASVLDTGAISENTDILSLFSLVLNDTETQPETINSEIVKSSVAAKELLAKIGLLINSDNKAAILSNMTPDELTILQSAIDKTLTSTPLSQNEKNILQDVVAELVSLTPVQTDEKLNVAVEMTSLVSDKSSSKERLKSTAESNLSKTQDTSKTTDTVIKASVDPVNTAPSTFVSKKHFSQSRYDNRYDIGRVMTTENGSDAQANTINEIDTKGITKDILSQQQSSNAGNSNAARTLQNFNNFESALTLSGGTTSATTASATVSAQTSYTQQSNLTNPVVQTSHASQPHPATQTVAATIQRAAKEGQDTNIRIKLDPPELGRVEVKMSIDKNSKTKIVLMAEKPETLALLQKDAHVLERALQDSGLDGQGNLSFELSQGGQNFDNQNNRGGGHDNGGNGYSDTENNEDVIETTMTWHVDPLTGSMRYNALV